LNDTQVEYGDYYHRRRIQSLQAVDEFVDAIVLRLEEHGILDNTYVIFTTDNGFHIGQHRLIPGKSCAIEEDINIPLMIRGPDVPKGHQLDLVTTHTDLSPTFLKIAGINLREDLDGSPMPLTAGDMITSSDEHRQEHVNVEYWGTAPNAQGTSVLENRTTGTWISPCMFREKNKMATLLISL
jgi:arylsulfatase